MFEKTEGIQIRYTVNIGHKTQDEDKTQNHNTELKSNPNPTKKNGLNQSAL